MFKENRLQNSFCYYICIFFVCCVAGWFFEVLFRSAKAGMLVIPGFLYGCYLPIYGFGALMLMFVFSGNKLFPGYVFAISFVLLTAFEYITHFAFDKVFDVQLWSYSAHFCNINGRVSLKQSIMLGIGGMAFVYVIYPFLNYILRRISEKKIQIFSFLVIIVMTVDTTFSVLKIIKNDFVLFWLTK